MTYLQIKRITIVIARKKGADQLVDKLINNFQIFFQIVEIEQLIRLLEVGAYLKKFNI
ncbi:unnamed protein product [Paramecium primaurelia]|uniref:Uncharacterized protein n=1 Tax=Paramecium primaurelia TaxID=5886 RepID=A0A8S1QPS7_PARPR|nr:unnamed protein product [Paramecium primaurelia]